MEILQTIQKSTDEPGRPGSTPTGRRITDCIDAYREFAADQRGTDAPGAGQKAQLSKGGGGGRNSTEIYGGNGTGGLLRVKKSPQREHRPTKERAEHDQTEGTRAEREH